MNRSVSGANPEAGGYRRGLVLGLTMAELMILIVFVLLLTLAMLLSWERQNTERAQYSVIELSNQLKELEQNLEIALQASSGSKSIGDLRRELVIAQTANRQLAEEVAEFSDREQVLQRIEDVLSEAEVPLTPDAVAEVISQAEKYQKIRESDGSLAEAIDRAVIAESEVGRMSGQLANALRQQESAGRGTEYPSCWAKEDGSVEYIYNVALQSNGFVVRETDLPHRLEERARLPVSSLRYDGLLSEREILQATAQLFEWSKERKCRFFVRVFDQTGVTEKTIYQSRLRTVENHFYKYLSRSDFR